MSPLTNQKSVRREDVEIPDDRDLTTQELLLARWLLLHGSPDAIEFIPQLTTARVASRCYCGCASINFAIDGLIPKSGECITILADYEWTEADGKVFGCFIFTKSSLLAGLEIWSQDGLAMADKLPSIDQLRPIGMGQAGEQSQPFDVLAGPISIVTSSTPAR